MQCKAPFQIYNASAGSGKTFSLVKNYLAILLNSDNPHKFKNILAITFTNKAVNEMKDRILKSLFIFSDATTIKEPPPLFLALKEDLNISSETIHKRAKIVLKNILNNYAAFNLVTIDKFNHRLLQNFSVDIKLPSNFEVILNEKEIISKAIDNTIDKIGHDTLLTELLVDFAIEKTDNDKSWDITLDLKEIASYIYQETHIEYIKTTEKKTLEDFKLINYTLQTHIRELEQTITNSAKLLLKKFEDNALDRKHFTRGWLPDFLNKIASNKFNVSLTTKWQENIATEKLYPKSTPTPFTTLIDTIQPSIASTFNTIKKNLTKLAFLKNFKKNIIPVALINTIFKELETIKQEQNIVFISEFNHLIANAIYNQPAPFIYERIGEKYQHYFIDEFQDTSTMQWNNLIPLISNALQTEISPGKSGTLFIVGDAKQAIYRWRGGKVEQFIRLYNEENPFYIQKKVSNLPINFRSYDEIVLFNNLFFKYVSTFLQNSSYKALFEKFSSQKTNKKEGGFVQLHFIEQDNTNNTTEDHYALYIHKQINKLITSGYCYKDICILTRRKKEGILIANYLTEQNIPVISSESLLLKNNSDVAFLIHLMAYLIQPEELENQFNLLILFAKKKAIKELHQFLLKNLKNIDAVFDSVQFSSDYFHKLSLYNGIEYAINCFELATTSNAYIQFFLDEVWTFTQKQHNNIRDFLSYWKQESETLSIASPQNTNAVQTMTIHKSKGLEFKIVLYPFANTTIHQDLNFALWYPVEEASFNLKYALIDKKSTIAQLDDKGSEVIAQHDEKLILDNFNLLYVALTRAIKQLYIITNKTSEKDIKTFSGLFTNYLKKTHQWDPHISTYEFGDFQMGNSNMLNPVVTTKTIPYISNVSEKISFKAVTKSGTLWNTTKGEAILRGNLYHLLLANIHTKYDIATAINNAIKEGYLQKEDKEHTLKKINDIVNHPLLHTFFTTEYTIFIERELFSETQELLRPDRFMIKENDAFILEYKTGQPSKNHKKQLNLYKKALTNIGYQVQKILLVYVNDIITVLEI